MQTSSLFSELLPTPASIASIIAEIGPTLGRKPTPAPEPAPASKLKSKPPESTTEEAITSNSLPPRRTNPWQRQGTTLLDEATTDPDIAIGKAGLDWDAHRVDIRSADTLDPIPDFKAIRRSDTGAILGVVGKNFEPYQNRQMFNVIKELSRVGREGMMPLTIETAGSFQGGRVTWVLAHLPDLGIRIGDDHARVYLLLSTGHVGNRGFLLGPTTIRPICGNTLQLAETRMRDQRKRPGLAGGFTIKHLPGMHLAADEARDAFAATIRSHAATKAAWEFLASKPLTTALKDAFLGRLFGRPGTDEADRAQALRRAREARIDAIIASPTSQVHGTKDSGLSLLHSVVEYIDHDRTTRSSNPGESAESRHVSATYGSGSEMKSRAFDAILELTGA